MTTAIPRNVLFISHANPEDNHFVRWLGAKLSAMGYEVWADVMRLRGGDDWTRELELALRNRAVKMLVVCTPSGLSKQGVRNEIEIAVGVGRQLNDSAFIIPIRLGAYEAPFRIAQAQYVDFQGAWARGFAELSTLLAEKGVPRAQPGAMHTWLESHARGAARLSQKSEPLISNWLEVFSCPNEVFYCTPPVGLQIEQFQNRLAHYWPVVPHGAGVVTFSLPDAQGRMGQSLVGKQEGKLLTSEFVNEGWQALGIDRFQARRMYSDLVSQAFDAFARARGLKPYVGAGKRVGWWADVKTAPVGQVRFDWNFRRGARQIVGQSAKRGVHWHYAIHVNLRTSPLQHLRIASRLVFSRNGLDSLEDVRRAHTLRRSFAKGWRNARWRDMLGAFLWWLSGGKSELRIPVASEQFIFARLPTMQFGCPVSIASETDHGEDDDDPDVPDETSEAEQQNEVEE